MDYLIRKCMFARRTFVTRVANLVSIGATKDTHVCPISKDVCFGDAFTAAITNLIGIGTAKSALIRVINHVAICWATAAAVPNLIVICTTINTRHERLLFFIENLMYTSGLTSDVK